MKVKIVANVMQGILGLLSLLTATTNSTACPNVISRHDWGGVPAQAVHYQNIPVEHVVIHHTNSHRCTSYIRCADQVVGIQTHHMEDNRWHDIGFNFLIGGDGTIFEGVGWHKRGSHTHSFNDKSIGIAFIGNFNSERPSRQSLDAALDLLACGVTNGYLSRDYRLLGARQLRRTGSPGSKLYREIQEWEHWVDYE